MSIVKNAGFLRTILVIDAATCVATGALMTFVASPLSNLLQLPRDLLFYAGLSLFPIAAFIAMIAAQSRLNAAGVWLIILGNVGWVLGSLLVLFGAGLAPNTLGMAFIVLQAVAVAVLAWLEYVGLRQQPQLA